MHRVTDVLKALPRYGQHLINGMLRQAGILPDHVPQRLELDDQGREAMSYRIMNIPRNARAFLQNRKTHGHRGRLLKFIVGLPQLCQMAEVLLMHLFTHHAPANDGVQHDR
ncbi:hypothetical protein D3C81_1380340 [compost metagenome]